jgi:D-aminoacyl-tRNA deacylase
MKVVIQRTAKANVTIDGKVFGKINNGLVILVGFTVGDTINEIETMVNKIINLRIFDDSNGVMNISLKDINGSILSISQFTLYADTSKGRRPSYINSLPHEQANELYNIFNECLKNTGLHVETGVFGANMKVELINDGPVTIIMENKN